MSNDTNNFKQLKNDILENNQVEELLFKLECRNINKRNNRVEAGLPEKFEHNNTRAVQVKLNENLNCVIYNLGVNEIDIYGLVSFIKFNCSTEEDQRKNLRKSFRWISEQLGYNYSYSMQFQEGFFEEENPLEWLNGLKKSRRKKHNNFENIENKIYDDNLLNQYIMYPLQNYIDEGISPETQMEFNVGFDLKSKRIIFPIRNRFGEIVAIKGRTIEKHYKEKNIPKFFYLYSSSIAELYNFHNAVYYILEKKEVIIFESEKSCWLATQWGYRNCVAIGSSDLTPFQINCLKELGIEIKIIIALDKDKTKEEFIKQGKKFGMARSVFAMWDKKNLLSKEKKHSPVDLGEEIFSELYKNTYNYRIT